MAEGDGPRENCYTASRGVVYDTNYEQDVEAANAGNVPPPPVSLTVPPSS